MALGRKKVLGLIELEEQGLANGYRTKGLPALHLIKFTISDIQSRGNHTALFYYLIQSLF